MKKSDRDKLREYSARMKGHNSSPCYVCTDELINLLDSYERLVEALKFYADENNWSINAWATGYNVLLNDQTNINRPKPQPYYGWAGDRARQALAEVENE